MVLIYIFFLLYFLEYAELSNWTLVLIEHINDNDNVIIYCGHWTLDLAVHNIL